MINAGIFKGDIAIVDKSVQPTNGKIVIAVVDGEMLIRRYEKSFNKLLLVAEAPKVATIEVNEISDAKVWGVVMWVMRMTG